MASDDLRARIAAAIWERQNPGRSYPDEHPRWRADAEADADAVMAVLDEVQQLNDDAWGSVWLHRKWSWLTKCMTTEEREHAADCVARWSARLEPDEPGEPEGLRWWREPGDPCSTCGGVDLTRCDCMRPERN